MSPGNARVRPKIRPREVFLVVAGYLLVTALYWEPFLTAPGQHYSVGRDYFQNTWNLWWTAHAAAGHIPFYDCRWLFAPTGTSLAFHTITFANTMPGLILQDWLGLTATHSVLFLSAFFFSALAAWALARHVTGSAWGAFLAGLFYSFNPYHTAMVTQLNNAQFQWIPLFLLALLLLYEQGRWWHVAWAGILLALAGYADWYQPIFCALAGGLILLLRMLRDRRLADTVLWMRIAAMGAAGALLMLPGVLPLARVMGESGGELEVGVRYAGEMGLLGVHPQGSPYFHFWPVFLGWTTCFLLVWAAWKVRDGAARVWWWLGGLSFLFLQGPYLVLGNRHFESIPMPMALFPHLPVLSVIRVPHRFLILFGLAVAILAAFALRELLGSLERGAGHTGAAEGSAPATRARRGASLALAGSWCVLLALELQPPSRTPIDLQPAPFYDELREDPARFTVLELPIDFRDAYTMYLQTRHEKRLMAGYTSHILPAAVEALRTDLMRALLPAAAAYDVDYLPTFREVDVDALDEATLLFWREELLEDDHVRVICFHDAPDFPAPVGEVPEELSFAAKMAAALTPFRFNRPASDVEFWRQRNAVEGMEALVQSSLQARRIIERLFGPPDLIQGRTEIWDLRGR